MAAGASEASEIFDVDVAFARAAQVRDDQERPRFTSA